jgi:RsiW-degrading membrane proteinase PrsW (M82 family)
MLILMTIVALVFASFLPLILWSIFAVRSRYLSAVCLLLAVLSSLGAIAAASLAQVILDPVRSFFSVPGSVFFSSFVESALIEECSKFALLYWLVRRCGERRCEAEGRWILSCAFTLGLGFSAFETVAYAFMNPDIVWLRSVTALFVHGSTALAAGGLVAASGRRGRGFDDGSARPRFASSLALFIVAIALHGAYNAALLIMGFVPASFIVLFLVGLAVHVWGKVSAS